MTLQQNNIVYSNGDSSTQENTPKMESLSIWSENVSGSPPNPHPDFYDTSHWHTGFDQSKIELKFIATSTGGFNSMADDATGGKTPGSNQRRFQSRRTPARPSPAHANLTPQENRIPGPSNFRYTTPSPYGQQSPYGAQYTMSPAPPITIGLSSPYFHSYHPGLHPSPDMPQQNLHINYQSMIQPYQYQQQSPDGVSHPVYYHSSVGPSPPPHSPVPSSSGPVHSVSYAGQAAQYNPPNYPPSQQFTYPHSFASTPPLYRSQYAPSHYQQHFSPDQEGQGTWWYLPHNTTQPSFQSHYPLAYQGDAEHPSRQSRITSPANDPGDSPLSPKSTPPEPVITIQPNLSTASVEPKVERPVVRRPYHPNPPAHRSEWVMWAGNVPADGSHDELWRFFNQPSPASTSASNVQPGGPASGGVVSIFLISRSNCAFINFATEAQLQAAILRFHGQPLRSSDPRCPRLVCRARRKDDDLKAGVGGQRGMGMHTRWVKDQKGKAREANSSPETSLSSSPGGAMQEFGQLSLPSYEDVRSFARKNKRAGTSTESYASTNSSMLAKHFPQRYFILKSLSQFDLDLSVEKGLWATQKHNEIILDQAYRTSKEVYLIFGVNKSGEFYGYAKMEGPVLQGEHRVSWAARTDSSPSSRSSVSVATGRSSLYSDPIPEEPSSPSRPSRSTYFSPAEHRLVEDSPLPYTPQSSTRGASTSSRAPDRMMQSAPAELGAPHRQFTMSTPDTMRSLNAERLRPAIALMSAAKDKAAESFKLDGNAPLRAVRNRSEPLGEQDGIRPATSPLTKVVEEEERAEEEDENRETKPSEMAARPEGWGESFKIEWIRTDRVPFYRTRHLRNPWNHDREIKVSRDGTELEPSIGKQLLEEWQQLAEAATSGSAKHGVGGALKSVSSPALIEREESLHHDTRLQD